MNSNASATLTTRTKTGVDSYNDDVYTETQTPDVGVIFAPGGSVEQTQNGDTVITQPTVYLPADVDVSALDAITVAGYGTFEVQGTPQVWPAGLSGWRPDFPVVVQLRQVTG